MTRLSINVNKLATLRNARGKNNPDVLKMTLDLIRYGAQGITVHPRPDGRHIRRDDVYAIARAINIEFNIEGYPDEAFLSLAREIKPTQCTLVPDPPEVLTSNAGWAITPNAEFLADIVAKLHAVHVRTSLFIDPFQISASEITLLQHIGTDRVELYTEAYAEHYGTPKHNETLARYQAVAADLKAVGIGVNAGHDLNLDNLPTLIHAIPSILEVSIGHALICDALYLGLEETVARYLACLISKH